MIVGDITNIRKCRHDSASYTNIDELYVFCRRCRRIVMVVPRKRIPFKDLLTRELLRTR